MSKDTKIQPHYIFGRHAAQEAISAGVPIEKAYLSEKAAGVERGAVTADTRVGQHTTSGAQDAATHAQVNQCHASQKQGTSNLVAALEEHHIPCEIVSNRRLESLAKNASHQGVLLEVAPYSYAPLSQILDGAKGQKDALVIILDHIEDEGNLGAIARTAEVVGASGLVIPNARSAGVGAGAYKTSAGAVAYLPIAQVPNLGRTLGVLKDEGFWIVGATEHAQDDLWEAPLHGRIGLVMGSEKQGISPLVLKYCDLLAKIPQAGSIESLNVAQAATVFAYEWLRQSMIND